MRETRSELAPASLPRVDEQDRSTLGESVPCPGFTKRTTIYCSYFLFVSARARGATRFERGRQPEPPARKPRSQRRHGRSLAVPALSCGERVASRPARPHVGVVCLAIQGNRYYIRCKLRLSLLLNYFLNQIPVHHDSILLKN